MFMYVAFIITFLCYALLQVLQVDTLYSLVNLQSITSVIVFGILPLLGAGLLHDFTDAFRIVLFKKQNSTVSEMKRAIDAVELEIKAQLFAAVFSCLSVLLKLLHHFTLPIQDMKYALGNYLDEAIVSILFGMLVASLL